MTASLATSVRDNMNILEENEMLCVADYERAFQSQLRPESLSYFETGSGDEITLTQNRLAFNRIRIRPRVLRNVSSLDLSTSLLGQKIDIPVGISPTGFHGMAHPDAEIATAKASASVNTCMIVSQFANTSFETLVKAVPNGLKWANIYLFENRKITSDMVARIEANGYKGIVVTTDSPLGGNWVKVKRLRFNPKSSTPANLEKYLKGKDGENITYEEAFGKQTRDVRATWDYIDLLRSLTRLPIILKGILTAEDAILAVQHGVNAIIVSNHGGRGLDSSPATIEALPEIARAVGDKMEVYLDGGIRTGNDVFKALALGAKAVFVGRPVLYGLAHSGDEGVKHIFEILKREFHQTMGNAGCCSLSDITSSYVVHESYYYKI
ncbi:2-Hydroxyacid oxidase 2-like [Glandiceps talaboti]